MFLRICPVCWQLFVVATVVLCICGISLYCFPFSLVFESFNLVSLGCHFYLFKEPAFWGYSIFLVYDLFLL